MIYIRWPLIWLIGLWLWWKWLLRCRIISLWEIWMKVRIRMICIKIQIVVFLMVLVIHSLIVYVQVYHKSVETWVNINLTVKLQVKILQNDMNQNNILEFYLISVSHSTTVIFVFCFFIFLAHYSKNICFHTSNLPGNGAKTWLHSHPAIKTQQNLY